ncbi:MAG: SufD family Fe-S cluster assembly protein, partial [Methanobrevibacter sp.]|nr:SufD family Fe-S cluster assembly protein [Methanobrevibacter sp.]
MNLIIIENGAKAEIIERYHYHGEEKSRYFVNVVNEIYIGRDACLQHYKLQEDAYKACHISLTLSQVKARGYYENLCLQKGADIGRNEVVVKLVEPEAVVQVDAAYKMSGWAILDT